MTNPTVVATPGDEQPAEELRAEIAALTRALLSAEPEDPWAALSEAFLTGIAVPEVAGGGGLGPAETAAVLAEVGRHGVDCPALATMALGVLPLTRWGTAEQIQRTLRPVAEAGAVLTAALNDASDPMPRHPRTMAWRTEDGLRIEGVVSGVPYAERAHRILLPVTVETEPALVLLDPGAPGVEFAPFPSSSGTPVAGLRLSAVRVPMSALVPGGGEAVAELYRSARAGVAAVLDGLVAGALALTAAHVSTRHQFGRPLVTFQAVAQQLADVAITSRTLALAAAAAAAPADDGDPDGFADAEVAAFHAIEAGRVAIASCHHLHGGTGVDRSYPLHRYSAAATDLARLLGGADNGREQLADRLLGDADPQASDDSFERGGR